MKKPFELINHPKLKNPTLIIGWKEDTGNIAPKVIDIINKELDVQKFCDIDPVGYFSMAGVDVDDDYVQFPESSFYYSKRRDLVIFKSDQPVFNHYIFLNSVL